MKSIVARRDATETTEGAATAVAALPNADPVHGAAIGALMPLYVVIFIGFVGYSLMITVFTPMLLRAPIQRCCPWNRRCRIGQSCWECCFASIRWGSSLDRRYWARGRIASATAGIAHFTMCDDGMRCRNQCFDCLSEPAGLGLCDACGRPCGRQHRHRTGAIADIVSPTQRNRYFGYIYGERSRLHHRSARWRQTGRSDACSVVQRCNTILGKLRVTGPDHPYCPCSLPRGQGTPPATPPPSARDLRQPIAGLCQPTAAAVLYC